MIKIISRLKSSYRLVKYGLSAPKVKPETIYQRYAAKRMGLVNSSSLDLGCGNIPRNPFGADVVYGVDLFEQTDQKIKVADLAIHPIPFSDNSFDYITAFDFVEHIPRIIYAPNRSFPFVNLMNEVSRCLKPGGYFLSHTPAYPYSPLFRDPTHVNYITEETFSIYFDTKNTYAKIYGFNGGFKIACEGWNGFTLVSLLQKPIT